MELIQRYLQAVRPFLPRKQQEDIIRELSQNIMAQVEDKEAELGRPLTTGEQEDLLRRLGNPVVLALRYRSVRWQLIGPELMPVYLLVVMVAAGAIVLGHLGLAIAVLARNGTPGEAIGAFFGFFGAWLPMLGWVTLLFAVLTAIAAKFKLLDKVNACWDPKSLPKLTKTKRPGPIPVWQSVLEVVMGAFTMAAWLALMHFPEAVFGSHTLVLSLSAAWRPFEIPVLLLIWAGAAQSCNNLVRPHWTVPRRLLRLGTDLAVLVMMYVLFSAAIVTFLQIWHVSGGAQLMERIRHGMGLGFAVVGLIIVLDGLGNVYRLVRADRQPAAEGRERRAES